MNPAPGQLLIRVTFMDYQLPRAADFPGFDIDFQAHPLPETNPLGVKGAGEAGAIGAPPAFVNAVVDAIHPAHRSHHLRHAGNALPRLAGIERRLIRIDV